MALEDFERELAEQRNSESRGSKRKRSRSRDKDRDRHHRHHRHHHHRSSRHNDDDESRTSRHTHKHSKHREDNRDERPRSHRQESPRTDEHGPEYAREVAEQTAAQIEDTVGADKRFVSGKNTQRDSWMQGPSSVEYLQRQRQNSPPSKHVAATEKDFTLKIHQNELNKQIEDPKRPPVAADSQGKSSATNTPDVDYEFGDAGSQWRMTKLKGVYQEAKSSSRAVDTVALERYGTLEAFDQAREEEIEVGRREMRGPQYVGKVKPSGELYAERRLAAGPHRSDDEDNATSKSSDDEFEAALGQGKAMRQASPPATSAPLDQTSLNKLRAAMMRAKLRNAPDAAALEAQYSAAMSSSSTSATRSGVVVLNKMESRALAGSRGGEVKAITNKRGLERGLVEENEDMSIEDMVRAERRSKNQFSEAGKSMAERIARDAKFDNDLDYMDENAARLARNAPKSEVNLRNTAISEYQKTKRALEACPLCYHEDTGRPPLAPVLSLGTRVFLTLPTGPEITPYGLCASVVPVQHRRNLLECDDDEWEEMRNFMKSLARMYHAQSPARGVIFYENAAHSGRQRHASLEAVPLPLHLAESAPAFFREAMLAADEEWTQHRKVLDTRAKAEAGGMGKLAFRRSMVSELPYFHVWFTVDGGLGHVVEDERRWPKGDLFAREVLGGMLGVGPEVIKRQGRWRRGDPEMEARVAKFRKAWDKWDWTKALLEEGATV